MRVLWLTLLLLGLFFACDDPGGLDSVSGVQGTISFDPVWPDSLKSAVVVVFDVDLDLENISNPDYPVVEHFITFGDPVDPGTASAEYFIQLQPGGYIVMAIGLLLEPAQLLANEGLFQRIGEFILVPENAAPRGIIIREKEINEQTGWYVQF